MEALLYVALFFIWLLYLWGHVVGLDIALQIFGGQKPNPGLKPLHNCLGYVLAGLCLLTWFSGIGVAISAWLGFLPAVIVYIVVGIVSKH
jgi:hypothetical protein